MRSTHRLAAVATTFLIAAVPLAAPAADMTFFVTSSGLGNGADLGGVAGADKHCQALATAAGRGTTAGALT